jgi:hypothetical protein
LTAAAVNGVVSFSNLVLTQATLYTLSLRTAGLPTATSNSFTVTANTATQLALFGP